VRLYVPAARLQRLAEMAAGIAVPTRLVRLVVQCGKHADRDIRPAAGDREAGAAADGDQHSRRRS
jgi:hypothetical protein